MKIYLAAYKCSKIICVHKCIFQFNSLLSICIISTLQDYHSIDGGYVLSQENAIILYFPGWIDFHVIINNIKKHVDYKRHVDHTLLLVTQYP